MSDIKKMFPTEYVQGYTAALIDVKECIEYIKRDLKHHGMPYNVKNIMKMIDCMIQNRAILREDPDTFVRYNGKDKHFEIYKRQ